MRAFWLIFLPAAGYQFLALVALLRHVSEGRRSQPQSTFQPPVSVLKPLRGLDPNTAEAFFSQVNQAYPEFEVLFGAADPQDPATEAVRQLQSNLPPGRIRLIIGQEAALNGKVGVLQNLARHARYPIWMVNDSDIKVTSEYLARVVAPLEDSAIGVVTSLYRAKAHTAAAAWEALGIATDFMPSTLVAQLIGVREFGLGSTLAFRAEDLKRAGGFQAFADFIADDYQLAKRITALGKRCFISSYVVETSLGDASWSGVWRHQLRWARTIRISKGGGYAGLPLTHAGVWCVLALLSGAWLPALLLFALRSVSALVAGLMLGSVLGASLFWLAPLWDLYAFAIWTASYAGRKVRWRDKLIEIDSQGRIHIQVRT